MKSIKERLENRVEVLTRWSIEGPPNGATPPKSLAALMKWEDAKLGIVAIGHKNACTTNHPQNGTLVRECIKLMNELGNRRSRARPGAEADNKRLRQKLRAADDQITALIGQWHAARSESETLKRDMQAIVDQLARTREEVAQLKRDALKVVNLRSG